MSTPHSGHQGNEGETSPTFRKCVTTLDDDGAPLGDNFLVSELLRYGVRDANEKNRIIMSDRMIPSLYNFKETLALEYGPTICAEAELGGAGRGTAAGPPPAAVGPWRRRWPRAQPRGGGPGVDGARRKGRDTARQPARRAARRLLPPRDPGPRAPPPRARLAARRLHPPRASGLRARAGPAACAPPARPAAAAEAAARRCHSPTTSARRRPCRPSPAATPR